MLMSVIEKANEIPGLSITKKGRQCSYEFQHDNEPKVAVKQIRLAQKQLRLIKKELNAQVTQIRASYREPIATASYQPGIGGTLLGSKYRSNMKKIGAMKKRALVAERDSQIAPYLQAKTLVTEIIDQLSIMKSKVELGA